MRGGWGGLRLGGVDYAAGLLDAVALQGETFWSLRGRVFKSH